MALLSTFRSVPIEIDLLLKWIPGLTTEWLDKMVKKNCLIDDLPNKIRMHPLISNVIQSRVNFPYILADRTVKRHPKSKSCKARNHPPRLSYKNLMEKIQETIFAVSDCPYSAFEIQELSFAFYCTLSEYNIPYYSNEGQHNLSNEGKTWLYFCLVCADFYLEYGNISYANEVVKNLPVEYKKMEFPEIYRYKGDFIQLYSEYNHTPSSGNMEKFFQLLTLVYTEEELSYLHTPSSNSGTTDFEVKYPNGDTRKFTVDLFGRTRLIRIQETNIRFLLDIIIWNFKQNLSSEELSFYCDLYHRAFSLLVDLLKDFIGNDAANSSGVTNNVENYDPFRYRYLLSYYNIWNASLKNDPVSYTMDVLFPCISDEDFKLRLLSDIVYFEASSYLSGFSFYKLEDLKLKYKKMIQLRSKIKNLPIYIEQSYILSKFYFALCFPQEKKLIIEILEAFPDSIPNTVSFREARQQAMTTVSKTISELNNL